MRNDNECECFEYHYPVKIVCGDYEKKGGVVAPGKYFTAVNVHNPSISEVVKFRWKVAIALPGAKPGPISGFSNAQLDPDQALEIDCPDILKKSPKGTKFAKGFLVILTPKELDIVAVYTSSGRCCDSVVSFHTERVPARKIQVPCEAFDQTINTGMVDWRVIQTPNPNDPTKPPIVLDVPAKEVPNPPAVWENIAGSKWLSSGRFLHGQYRFRHCFAFCKGYQNAQLSMRIRTDNESEIFLNGSKIGSTPKNSWSKTEQETSITVNDPTLFQSGENCLEVVITNTGGPTGFTLAGSVIAEKARCPVWSN